ncbi:hypothetical protein VB264_06370 [Arcicella aquatica]|uniref:Uncharacterized protein n=1 Tax=Arcicella aquatica TaxID=217141 RepID=A0ABU5QK06_9BACT|nr:hypothetical protein [Arcicella aquatica]MEA5257400.1 hypothetical protein [Arcicella aquatica]
MKNTLILLFGIFVGSLNLLFNLKPSSIEGQKEERLVPTVKDNSKDESSILNFSYRIYGRDESTQMINGLKDWRTEYPEVGIDIPKGYIIPKAAIEEILKQDSNSVNKIENFGCAFTVVNNRLSILVYGLDKNGNEWKHSDKNKQSFLAVDNFGQCCHTASLVRKNQLKTSLYN